MTEAFKKYNENGTFPAVLVCEHASNRVPSRFHNLGLSDELLDFHIAWDPGALDVAKMLAKELDCPLVAANVSRLVYDCNRPPQAQDSIPPLSEIYEIPGNADISLADRNWRIENIYHPFHEALEQTIAQQKEKGVLPAIITIHSFTPVYKGEVREVEIGILHDQDSQLADLILQTAENGLPYKMARNEPYSATDGVTHTLQRHAIQQNLRNVMIEIRNDLIKEGAGAAKMVAALAPILRDSVMQVSKNEKRGTGE